jgi:glucokinase
MQTTTIPISQQYAIGIDVGGTNTKFGLVNHRGDISLSWRYTYHKKDTVEGFINELYDALIPAINDSGGMDYIRGIGIGAPNGNIYKGTIEYAPI